LREPGRGIEKRRGRGAPLLEKKISHLPRGRRGRDITRSTKRGIVGFPERKSPVSASQKAALTRIPKRRELLFGVTRGERGEPV